MPLVGPIPDVALYGALGASRSLLLKRAFDFSAAVCGIIVMSPLLALLLLAIRLTTPGPAMLSQTRVGRDGRHFVLYKLRTMRHGAPWVPTHLADPADLTQIGCYLRRYKLDELPQLYNVVRGDMSLVGPRPCLPTQVEVIEARFRTGAYTAMPGLTGLAQVSGINMSQVKRLAEIDGMYARNRTFLGDLKLIIATFLG
jgi:O-antigen biosynthesis protein WbqP